MLLDRASVLNNQQPTTNKPMMAILYSIFPMRIMQTKSGVFPFILSYRYAMWTLHCRLCIDSVIHPSRSVWTMTLMQSQLEKFSNRTLQVSVLRCYNQKFAQTAMEKGDASDKHANCNYDTSIFGSCEFLVGCLDVSFRGISFRWSFCVVGHLEESKKVIWDWGMEVVISVVGYDDIGFGMRWL